MPVLELRPREECAFDHVSLGEVMLRLDPGDMRIKTAREFRVWEGGGEYNVARGLRRCFGLRTAIVTALADNAVGRLVEDLMLQGGVDVSQVRWVPYDGLGRTVRNGLNFTERGYGIRGAQGVSDRGHTAASQLKSGDIDWEHIFGTLGARWFHTGGIYAGLSETTPEVIEAAMTAARRHGTVVSYDLNYRPSLWESYGGQRRAQEVNRELAKNVDVMIGNEEDFTACLGFTLPNTSEDLTSLEAENFKTMIGQVTAEFGFSVVATTLRGVISATVNDWGAIAWSAGSGFVEARHRPALEIYDRVGGGDSFASGLIYGLVTSGDLQTAVEYGAAHGALAMTTPGDTSMASLAEVEALVAGASARVQRLSLNGVIEPHRDCAAEGAIVKRLNQGIYANITSGVIAAVIFLVIALATGWTAARALLGTLILGVGTFVVAFLITQAITLLPDPPHAVRGRVGVVAELLGHQADAAADAEPADGLGDRGRDRIASQHIGSLQR